MHIFHPILSGASLRDRLIACLGALLGVALTGLLCSFLPIEAGTLPLLVAPIGASAVLLFAVPASPLAQPWPVVGGNVVSALIGVAVAHVLGTSALAAGTAVAGAILAMSLMRCLHPPGGAAALTAVIGGPAILSAGYAFPFVPVGLNSLILVVAGWLFHRFSGHVYPHRPVQPAQATLPNEMMGFHQEAMDRALADLGESFDIDRRDLDLLLQRAEFHQMAMQRS